MSYIKDSDLRCHRYSKGHFSGILLFDLNKRRKRPKNLGKHKPPVETYIPGNYLVIDLYSGLIFFLFIYV